MREGHCRGAPHTSYIIDSFHARNRVTIFFVLEVTSLKSLNVRKLLDLVLTLFVFACLCLPLLSFAYLGLNDIELKDHKTRNEERHWRSAAATAAAGI